MEISFLIILLCGDSCGDRFTLGFTGTTCMACTIASNMSLAFLKLKNGSF